MLGVQHTLWFRCALGPTGDHGKEIQDARRRKRETDFLLMLLMISFHLFSSDGSRHLTFPAEIDPGFR